MTKDGVIKEFAAKAQAIYKNRTAGEHTWEGFLAEFAHRYQREDGLTASPLDAVLFMHGYERAAIAGMGKGEMQAMAVRHGITLDQSDHMSKVELVQEMLEHGWVPPTVKRI